MDLIAAILLFLLSLVGLQPKQPTPPPPPPAPLGYNLGLDPSRDGSGIPNGVTAIRASGATLFRDGFSWSWLTDSTPEQPVPASLTRPLTESGNAVVDELDRKYQALTEAGIQLVIAPVYAPAWASSRPQCGDRAYETANPVICNRKYHPTAEFLPQYREVMAALARRYPKATFEGWNEPDNEVRSNVANATTPEKLADEQCALYEAVKSVDGARTVLSPSMSDYYVSGYIGRYLTALAGRRCHDAFSTHPYTGAGAAAVDAGIDLTLKRVRTALQAHGDKSPIWATEIGYSTSDGSHDDATQTVDLQRAIDRLRAQPDVRAIIVHALRDEPAPWLVEGREAGFGLLRTDWSPKPAFCALVAQAKGSYPGC
ncbi:glycosyl hydrolase [Patulibacter defluvii]|uniref:glycosyl hydrolase n=1 Tax=Patulibacter defluvii TaxID=3095358 RepID=UPI002A756468|nr:glycosyl hydrolase [Patulibacter sp. DM4]